MPFKGGLEAAAKMLAGLDPQAQERILQDIASKNPQMAQALRESMVTFDDLQFLSVKMLQELLREISIKDLALGLRIGCPELKNKVLSNVSKGLRSEIEEVLLGPPRPVEQVQEAVAKVMEVVRAKVEKGELVLRADDQDV